MSDITKLLQAAGSGDRLAADRAFALLYADLQRLARSRLRHGSALTLLDTTALVHESYLRLQAGGGTSFADRHHFMAYAAKVMRAVVIDVVRARLAERRGGGAAKVTLDTGLAEGLVDGLAAHDDEVLRVHEALDELAALEPRLAQVVELRYFGGLTEAEIAASLDVTERTVQRDWHKARLFLRVALR
ncbi:ECF-type sigma factor [Rubrivivax sp. RP6-9]|uniref:ECF-type sigma factor n=1 Tax=Rubrivivax sp. RP6-9 TaxID=3415750 RepID=UPI003CC628D0